MTFGTVTQASPLRVKVDGAATDSPAKRLASYTPVLSERVAVEAFASTVLVLGRVL